MEETRRKALQFFNADPEEWDLVFTANATAAIKLVHDCFRDSAETQRRTWWYVKARCIMAFHHMQEHINTLQKLHLKDSVLILASGTDITKMLTHQLLACEKAQGPIDASVQTEK